MKKMKLTAFVLLLSLCLAVLTGCNAASEQETASTRTFVDSCGRTVEIPTELNEIMPSGSLAQIVLYTICPDRLQSLSTPFTRVQKQYIPEEYTELPVTGQFYGGGSTVNYEEIIAADPDIIIDIGEAKENIATDMDELQEKTGIPVIFIEASIATMADAYDTLGELTGDTEQAAACAAYIRETLDDAAAYSAQIPENERKRVLYSQGEYGTEVLGVGSVHAEVLDYVGVENVAQLSSVAGEGGNEVSMDQILFWNPEVVILAPESNFSDIYEDSAWQPVQAVQNHQAYEVPIGPYSWLDRPPSVQRILGIRWLGNLIYPDVFDYDMIAEAREFYQLFFHYELSEAEARELMGNSTYLDADNTDAAETADEAAATEEDAS